MPLPQHPPCNEAGPCKGELGLVSPPMGIPTYVEPMEPMLSGYLSWCLSPMSKDATSSTTMRIVFHLKNGFLFELVSYVS